MSVEHLNLELFYLLNVPEHAAPFMQHFAMFIAHDLIYLMLLVFAVIWLRGQRWAKILLIKAVCFTAVALCISEVLSTVLNTPRPFVMEVGRTLIEHDATGAFPSNHMTIFSGIALSYYFSVKREIGRLLIAVAWLVAWSRIYVGVHFPIDMLGGFLIAFMVNWLGLPLWHKYADKLMDVVLWLHEKIFAVFIRQGWVK